MENRMDYDEQNRRSITNDIVEPCERDNFKPNCDPEESEEIECNCGNIYNAKCVGILAEKIFDCVFLESLQFADKDEFFAIDNFDPTDINSRRRYRVGDAVCIDDILLCYDFIGIKDDDNTEYRYYRDENRRNRLGEGRICVRYDMENKVFNAVPGSEHEVCNFPDNYVARDNDCDDDDRPSTVKLYDEFEGGIDKEKCNPESDGNATKSRVFKQGVRFHVDNLRVRIRGRIGSRPFTATKDYSCYGDLYGDGARVSVNPVEITKKDTLGNGEGCGNDVGLNFTPVNLYGRVGVPSDGRSTKSNIKFEPCLSAECIETDERYGDSGEGFVHATVGYSFLVTHNIRHTTSEELAVFINPNGVNCHDTSRQSDCRRREEEEEEEYSRPCSSGCSSRCSSRYSSDDYTNSYTSTRRSSIN